MDTKDNNQTTYKHFSNLPLSISYVVYFLSLIVVTNSTTFLFSVLLSNLIPVRDNIMSYLLDYNYNQMVTWVIAVNLIFNIVFIISGIYIYLKEKKGEASKDSYARFLTLGILPIMFIIGLAISVGVFVFSVLTYLLSFDYDPNNLILKALDFVFALVLLLPIILVKIKMSKLNIDK